MDEHRVEHKDYHRESLLLHSTRKSVISSTAFSKFYLVAPKTGHKVRQSHSFQCFVMYSTNKARVTAEGCAPFALNIG